MKAAASLVFTVHNRKDLLLEGLRLARLQTVPVEILVMDDCSTDGVGDAVRALFPDARYYRSDTSRGPSYQRNRGIELATSEIVFPLDDDSHLVSPRTIEQSLADLQDPAVAALAIPFVNVLQSDAVIGARRPDREHHVVDAFVACSFAVRRSVALSIGGFDESYFFMGEEMDLCLRLLDRGYRVELGTADPIHHHQPPNRRSVKADFYGRRNDVLFYWLHAPGARMPLRIAGTIAKGLVFGARNGSFRSAIKGLGAGIREIVAQRKRRHPVTPRTFDLFLRLKRGDEIAPVQVTAPRR